MSKEEELAVVDENPIAMDDEEFRKRTLHSISNGFTNIGDGIKQLGNIAEDNRREIRWYIKLALLVFVVMVVLVGVFIVRNPEVFSRVHVCNENGFETRFTMMEEAINFKTLYPNATCYFVTQENPGWFGLFKDKLGVT